VNIVPYFVYSDRGGEGKGGALQSV
jgi:hypothetical protein